MDFSAICDAPLWMQVTCTIVVTGAAVCYVFIRSRRDDSSFLRWRTKDYPKDVVLFHQAMRGPYTPSLTPFGVKAETYMRMAKIPYKNTADYFRLSQPKGKIPWFEYNGEVIPDSEFFIDFMNKKLEIDLNGHLSQEQKGFARALQRMVDENLYWTTLLHRWVHDQEMPLLKVVKLPRWAHWTIPIRRRKFKNQAWSQGMGRHTQEQVALICETDLQALSDILGQKKFMMGDVPCETDCSVFGQLTTIKWDLPGSPGELLLKGKFENLCKYCERMKATFWPDWDDCTTKGGTCEAKM